jgi:hypothetical protein
MKLLVGTLYTIEEEFDECMGSIARQTYRDFEQIIIKDLPKQEAHEALYGTFMERADEFDLLVKVDADMVLRDPELFRRIVEKFESDVELDLLLIGVHDFPCDRLVTGLNIFRNTVRWNLGEEALYTDMTYDRGTVRKKVRDQAELAPAATHMANPSPFQAFHWGFHKGVKVARGGSNVRYLDSLVRHYRRNRDLRLAHAVLGVATSFLDRFSVEHVSYTNSVLQTHFHERYGGMSADELHRAAQRTRFYRVFRLPVPRRILSRYYRARATRR